MFVDTEERKHGEVQAPAKVLDEPAKLLLRAAELIERHGHAKYALCDSRGRMCLVGALHVADGAPHNSYGITRHSPMGDSFQIAFKSLQKATGLPGSLAIPEWNNAAGRTQAEVVAKLREVAQS